MKTLSRILAICLFSAPLFSAVADGPVATTAGHNLTAYHPSDAYNNQWATASNGRNDSSPTAKVDFGNCNAVILRCAQPRCKNGGCSDMNVAANIVMGCVQANETCKQYGNDLINSMAAQLVASSTAKVNAQQAQIAQQQQAQQQQQMYEMQSQMQQQMAQMQQQMAEQNAITQQQLENALAQQQVQQQATLANITAAAESAAKERESGLTSYQEEAISRGVSADTLRRKQISGQIMTEIENAEVALKEVKTAMQDTFDYAECDSRGNNCVGPKRVKKFRERANNFIDPYEKVVEKISEALDTAAIVGGIDLSDIYMMMNNSCQKWMQYMCSPGKVEYTEEEGENGTVRLVNPKSCPTATSEQKAMIREKCETYKEAKDAEGWQKCMDEALKKISALEKKTCKPCTPLKVLTEESEIYEGWVNGEVDNGDENITVVACGDQGMLNNTLLGATMKKKKSAAGTLSIEQFARWLSLVEPGVRPRDKTSEEGELREMADVVKEYCFNDEQEKVLRSASLSRTLDKNFPVCVNVEGKIKNESISKGRWSDLLRGSSTLTEEEKNLMNSEIDNLSGMSDSCPYISPIYGLCDVHAYNLGKDTNSRETTEQAEVKEMVALKTTVIAQQMYKQYEYLSATLRRLKTALEKAVLTSTLEAGGAKSSGSSSAGGLAGSDRDDDKAIHLAGAENCLNKMGTESVIQCIQSNLMLILSSSKSNSKKAGKQLVETTKAAKMYSIVPCKSRNSEGVCTEEDTRCTGSKVANSDIQICAQELIASIAYAQDKKEEKKQSRGLLTFIQ